MTMPGHRLIWFTLRVIRGCRLFQVSTNALQTRAQRPFQGGPFILYPPRIKFLCFRRLRPVAGSKKVPVLPLRTSPISGTLRAFRTKWGHGFAVRHEP